MGFASYQQRVDGAERQGHVPIGERVLVVAPGALEG
jgi:hypothetical protein